MRKLYHQSSLRCREICGHYNLPNHNIQMSSWIFSESRYRNTLIQMQSKPPRTQWNLNLPRWNLWHCRNNLLQMQSKPPTTQWNLNLPRWNLWQCRNNLIQMQSKPPRTQWNLNLPRWNLWQCRNNLIQMQSKPPRTQWNLNLPRWNLWQPSHHRKISYSKKMKSASNIFIFIFIYITPSKRKNSLQEPCLIETVNNANYIMHNALCIRHQKTTMQTTLCIMYFALWKLNLL